MTIQTNTFPRDLSKVDTDGANITPPVRSRNLTPRHQIDPENDDPKLKLIGNDHLNDMYSGTGSSMKESSISERTPSPEPTAMAISKG